MSNTKAIGVAYLDQDIVGSSNVLATATGGQIGYTVGYGNSVPSVTQATSKSTGVTLNSAAGQITLNGAALASATAVTFTVTNNAVTGYSIPVACIAGGFATAGSYSVVVDKSAAGAFNVTLTNVTAGSLSEAVVIDFALVNIAAK